MARVGCLRRGYFRKGKRETVTLSLLQISSGGLGGEAPPIFKEEAQADDETGTVASAALR